MKWKIETALQKKDQKLRAPDPHALEELGHGLRVPSRREEDHHLEGRRRRGATTEGGALIPKGGGWSRSEPTPPPLSTRKKINARERKKNGCVVDLYRVVCIVI